ncbi:MAG: radical SAM protein, partial [Candidatus Aenigmarchaeota archaeon]|nr:radical SAM protein [Candidatus Aenigmarchaeota archaeon]
MVVKLEGELYDEIAKRIIKWYKGKKLKPVKLQFNPTNRCNLNCKFCWLRDFPNLKYNDELSEGRYIDLVNEAKKLGIKEIQITGGGEPLMRRDLEEIMKRIKKKKLIGKLTTNGTLFTKEFASTLVEIEWDEIVFSLDGPNEKINDLHRGIKGAFRKTVKWLKYFQREKKEKNRKKPKLSIHMVLTSKNYRYLPEMFKYVHSLGINNLSVEPIVLLTPKTKSGIEFLFKNNNAKKLMYYLEKAKLVARELNFQTNIDRLTTELIYHTTQMEPVIESIKDLTHTLLSIICYEPWYHIVIRPNGVTGPCCMFDGSVENVKEKSLKDIWFG